MTNEDLSRQARDTNRFHCERFAVNASHGKAEIKFHSAKPTAVEPYPSMRTTEIRSTCTLFTDACIYSIYIQYSTKYVRTHLYTPYIR